MRERKVRRSATLVAVGLAALVACGASGGDGANGRRAEGRTPAPQRPAPAAAATAQAATPAPAPQPAIPSNAALPSLAPLVDSVKASVINVTVRSRASGQMNEAARELWERFFGGQPPEGRMREQYQRGVGSGFLISPDGLAITNNHVVEGAVAINVKLDDGRTFDAEVLGRDPLTDLAVIKLKGKVGQLPSVPLGDSDALKVGDWVVAIGNPFGLASTVSAGIISAKAREIGAGPYDDFIQTDAAINPGNSGGPLFNLRGEVVGINTAIVGGANGMAATGIGFAVPANLAKALLPQLQQKGGAVTRGYIGVSVQNLTPEIATGLSVPVKEGALVSGVSSGSPGEKAGLKVDDVITRLDGEPITTSGQLTRRVALRRPGSAVTLEVYRGSNRSERKVTLGTRPDLEGIGLRDRSGGDQEEDERQEKLGLVVRDNAPGMGGGGGGFGEEERPSGVAGALIVEVRPGSAAESADLAPGMVVVEAGGKPVKSAADLRKVLRGAKQGSTVLLRVAVGRENRVLRAITIPE